MTGFRMMRPSATSLRIDWRELALEISLTSLGSSQILRSPQPRTSAARRFWVTKLTLYSKKLTCQPSTFSRRGDLFGVRDGFEVVLMALLVEGRLVKASSIARCECFPTGLHKLHLDQTIHARVSVVPEVSKSVGRWHSSTHILTALADDGRCR